MQIKFTNLDDFLKKFETASAKVQKAAQRAFVATVYDIKNLTVKNTPVGHPALWKYPAPKDYIPGTLKSSWKVDGASKFVNSYGTLKTTTSKYTIYNEQPYAERVEYGWSSQAPSGMLRISLKQAPSLLKKNALKYKV